MPAMLTSVLAALLTIPLTQPALNLASAGGRENVDVITGHTQLGNKCYIADTMLDTYMLSTCVLG
jgi:hypothetical protein